MSRPAEQRDLSDFMVSRRVAIQGLGVAGVAATLAAPAIAAAHGNGRVAQSVLAYQEASPVAASSDGWRMWYLASADAARPAAPGSATQAEIDEVIQAQAEITPEMTGSVRLWGTGLAIYPWSAVVATLFTEFAVPGGLAQSKILATLHTTMHDAAVAALDAQQAHARPGPAATDSRIVPAAGVNPEQPSFPSAHAAVAGAAAVVLTFLFPDAQPGRFDDMATAAAESRIAAGASFRSDVDAGMAMGRTVGDLAVAYSIEANDVAEWDPSTMPSGPGYWQPTPPAMIETPYQPLAGNRTPWVLESGDQFRPPPPPEHGSAAWKAELETVQELTANRTFEQQRGAVWWGTTSPALLFERWTMELIALTGSSLPEAARIHADVHAAIDDALIAVWDGKFTYWTSRPITEDPELVTALPTPPYPAYPGGYAAVMGAGSVVLGHYFPGASVDMEVRAWEGACSRLWAGIHYPMDNDAGLIIGRQVGRAVASLDRNTSSES